MKTASPHYHYRMSGQTEGDTMPLLRIMLVLRKFNVKINKVTMRKKTDKHCEIKLSLDFTYSPRIVTVFKKIARFYDVKNLNYKKERNKFINKTL